MWFTAGASLGSGEIQRANGPGSFWPHPAPPETIPTTTTTAPPPTTVAPVAPQAPRATTARRTGATPPVVGRIMIPSIGLDHTAYEGGDVAQINFGPSHMPNTALPGRLGNTVFAGHRVTYTHPFRHLDQLGPGDTVIFEVAGGRYTYEWTGTDVVGEEQVDILAQPNDYTATLFACHPPGSSAYRIVTHWRLLNAPPVPNTTVPPKAAGPIGRLPGR